jgi:hypothetical protein
MGHIEHCEPFCTLEPGHDGACVPVEPQSWQATAERLQAEKIALQERLAGAVEALLAAPMPERESIHKRDEWAERYGDWWHEHVRPHVLGGQ